MYIDKLDDTLNKYNNTYHKTIKMKIKSLGCKSKHVYWLLIKKIIRKVLNLKLLIMLEYQNIKMFH